MDRMQRASGGKQGAGWGGGLLPRQVATAVTGRTGGGQPQDDDSTGSAAEDEAGTAAQIRAAGGSGNNKQAKARRTMAMAGVESGVVR